MKLDEVNRRTKEAVAYLVLALESGRSEVLVHYLAAMGRFHSSDMLYLAGVNEHTVLRIVGSKRWRVAHFLRRIQ